MYLRRTTLADSFPDAVSYPATLVASRPEGPMADSFHNAAARWAGSPSRAITKTYLGQPHPLLAKLLPRVTFTRTQVFIPPEFHGTLEQATMGGRIYRMDALNRLLLEAGFTFDSTEMPTIAKIAVLFATFGQVVDTSDRFRFVPRSTDVQSGGGFPGQFRSAPMPTDSQPGHGFPAITFLSVKKGEWQHPVHKDIRRGVRVDCMVDGRRTDFLIEFTGMARAEPDFLFTTPGEFLMMFEGIPLPLPAVRQQRGSRSTDDPQWNLAVTCDSSVWSESESGFRGHGFRGHNT